VWGKVLSFHGVVKFFKGLDMLCANDTAKGEFRVNTKTYSKSTLFRGSMEPIPEH